MDGAFCGKLVCPVTHRPLILREQWLYEEGGARRYPIRNGIAVLVPQAGELIDDSSCVVEGDGVASTTELQ